jgi:hypothetical protein
MATPRLSKRFTKQQVLAALEKHHNVKHATAEGLGISWNGLGTLMADHGIESVPASQAKTTMQSKLSKEEVEGALARNGYIHLKTSEDLGISRNTLRALCRRHDIELPDDGAKVVRVEETVTIEEEHRLKREVSLLRGQLREALDAKIKDEDIRRLFLKASEYELKVPKHLSPPPRRKKKERAIVSALFSDWHFDEVVRPEEFNWTNGYNREIATLRLRTYFRNLVRLCRDYINGVEIEGLTFLMLGDMLSGIIHDELRQTNDDTVMGGLLYWSREITAGLNLLLEYFPWIYVAGIVGNHGRNDRKPRMKLRARDNFEWLMYHMIARDFENVKEITFNIPESTDWGFNIYNKRHHLTHGDQFRGGSGISGILTPVTLGDHRKLKRELGIGTPYDYLWLGHFHQMKDFGGIGINGSGKGYDEYAAISNFPFERPRQALWLNDPTWGKVDWREVRVISSKHPEPWMKKAE